VSDTPKIPADGDWAAATYEGNRRLQRRAAMALSLREKIQCLEDMEELALRLRSGAKQGPGDGAPHGDSGTPA
jgi:hypothetical protein